MDKKALFAMLNEALALEQALIEAQGTMSARAADGDLRQAAGIAGHDDEHHLVLVRRMLGDLGGRVEAPSMDQVAWIEALVRNVSTTDDDLERLGLVRMLKMRAVAHEEIFDRIRFTMGNPPEMEPLVVILRQDHEHAQRYAEIEMRLATRQVML